MIRDDVIYIKEFDINQIRPTMKNIRNRESAKGFKITVIGKPGTGKSFLIRSIMYAKRNLIPTAMVFSGTEDNNHFYQNMIPRSFIYNEYDETKILEFHKRQKIAKDHVANPWSMVIVDDCTHDPKQLNTPIVQNVYKNGRHWYMLFILSLQYCMDVKPGIRSLNDGTFILRESNLSNRKKLYENYAGCVGDFQLFCTIMDQITNDYTALYIDNSGESNKLEDILFWYKAPMVPENFKFGCPEYWQFDAERYNPLYEDGF